MDYTTSMGAETLERSSAWRHVLPIEFTGSGSEYFRIWVVNLLLTIVTLGLYYPWAKVRRLRYFCGNTKVGGYPLDFHGDPKKMLRGFVLVMLLLAAYSGAGHFSAVAGLVALVVMLFVWPPLLRASMQFRLANTSWRGLRMRFVGDVKGAYVAMAPAFVAAMVLAVLGLLLRQAGLDTPEQEVAPRIAWLAFAPIAVMLVAMLALPLMWWLMKKYQHDHYAIAHLQAHLSAGPGRFYAIFAKAVVLALAVALAGVLLFGAFFPASARLQSYADRADAGAPPWWMGFALIGVMLAFLAMFLVSRPYFVSRMQNLLWGRTGNDELRFVSTLRFWPLFRLSLKNLLLMGVTLGLYWPFAMVATTRMQMEAIKVETQVDPDTLFSAANAQAGDAAGDAAGDLFGIDIGM